MINMLLLSLGKFCLNFFHFGEDRKNKIAASKDTVIPQAVSFSIFRFWQWLALYA